MKNFQSLFFLMLFLTAVIGRGQTEKTGIYNPSLDARAELAKMAGQAKAEGKHILLQVGGNW